MTLDTSVFDKGSLGGAMLRVIQDWQDPRFHMPYATRYNVLQAMRVLFEERRSIQGDGLVNYLWWSLVLDECCVPRICYKPWRYPSRYVRMHKSCNQRYTIIDSIRDNMGDWPILFPEDCNDFDEPDYAAIMLKYGLQMGYSYLSRVAVSVEYSYDSYYGSTESQENVDNSEIIYSEHMIEASIVYIPIDIARKPKTKGLEVLDGRAEVS